MTTTTTEPRDGPAEPGDGRAVPPGRGPRAGRGLAALAGVLGGGLALGLAELAAGLLGGMPSLLDAVGGQVIQVLPGDLLTWGIETLGAADRAIMATLIAVAVLAVGAVAGVARRRGTGLDVWLFAGVALAGIVLTLPDINADAIVVVPVVAAATAVGWWAMAGLVAAATPTRADTAGATPTGRGGPADAAHRPDAPADGPDGDTGVVEVARRPGTPDGATAVTIDRRAFLARAAVVGGAAAAAAAVGRVGLGRALGGSGAGAGSVATGPGDVVLPAASRPLPEVASSTSFDVPGLSPLFVPNEDFYRIDTAVSGPPVVDASDWSMRIHGLVDAERTFTLEDLLERDLVEAAITIACVSNDVGGGLIGNARWLGVPLAGLLDEAGVQPGGTQVVGRAVDGFTVGFPTEVAMDGRAALLAVGMNGEPLPLEHGFPARLVVPGLYGYVSATKWLSDIELVGWDDFDAYWVPRGWSKRGPIKTQSRIDTPASGDEVPAGEVVVAGVAWAQTRGIQRVEVEVDGTWQDAELATAVNADTWVQWRAAVELDAGAHTIRVRATDGEGETQPEARTPEHPNGAEGWHAVRVEASA